MPQTSRTREKLSFNRISLNWTCSIVMDQRIIVHAYAKLPLRPLHSRRESNFAHIAIPEATTTTLKVSNFHEASVPMEE
ncbi:hypothetical protein COP1_014516 [Malus domestica]